ncbi:MAG: hypothetical protein ACREUR_04225, partial [Nitrosospira sp.]
MTLNLFEDMAQCGAWQEELCPGAVVLRGFALPDETTIFAALGRNVNKSPYTQIITPGGFLLSDAITKCGYYGWV